MALRQCLSRRAASSPTVPDLAERAIRHGHRTRRRRSAAAAAVVALTAAAATAGGWQLGGVTGDPRLPLAEPTRAVAIPEVTRPFTATPGLPAEPLPGAGDRTRRPLAAVPARPVDLVVADRLDTTGGQRVDLSAVGAVTQAGRGDGGWLLVGTSRVGVTSLWFVTPTEPPKVLLPAADAVVLAADGRRVAWLAAGRTSVATVTAGRLAGVRQTPVPPHTRPVGFVGEAVLLTRQLTGGEIEGYDVWWPDGGPYEAAWNPSLIGVYGPLPDGRTAVAQVAGDAGRPCLALLDVIRGLPVLKRACVLPLTAGGAGTVSPDGRWLFANGTPSTPTGGAATLAAETALLVELPSAFRARPAPHLAGPRVTGGVAWTSATTVIYPGGLGQLVRVSVERLAEGDPTAVERLTVPSARPNDRVLVVSGSPG